MFFCFCCLTRYRVEKDLEEGLKGPFNGGEGSAVGKCLACGPDAGQHGYILSIAAPAKMSSESNSIWRHLIRTHFPHSVVL